MTDPVLALLVKFKSRLPMAEVRDIIESRADDFRALTGLRQKYYLEDSASGEIAGLYLWESAEALDEYRQSRLRATIAEAYQAEGEPEVRLFNIVKILRE